LFSKYSTNDLTSLYVIYFLYHLLSHMTYLFHNYIWKICSLLRAVIDFEFIVTLPEQFRLVFHFG